MPRKLGYVLPSSPSDNSVIDHQSYPHLIDEIFFHAESLSTSHLLSLRTASSAWRERVDRRIAYHLVTKGNMVPIEVHSGILRCRLMTVTAENLNTARGLRPSWARYVRVIDVDATSKHKDLCDILTAWQVNHYETLRFTNGLPVYGKWSMLCEQPTRTVYLQSPPYAPEGHFEGVRRSKVLSLAQSSRFMGGRPKKAVVHQTRAMHPQPELMLVSPLISEPALRGLAFVRLTVIFHQWEVSATGNVSDDCGKAFPGNFGETLNLIEWNGTRVEGDDNPVVVVGFENLSARSVGLDRFNLVGGALQHVFGRVLEKMWEAKFHKPPQTDDGNYDDSDVSEGESDTHGLKFGVKFKTGEEYESELARADFEIENSALITTVVRDWPYSDRNAKAEQRSASKSKPV